MDYDDICCPLVIANTFLESKATICRVVMMTDEVVNKSYILARHCGCRNTHGMICVGVLRSTDIKYNSKTVRWWQNNQLRSMANRNGIWRSIASVMIVIFLSWAFSLWLFCIICGLTITFTLFFCRPHWYGISVCGSRPITIAIGSNQHCNCVILCYEFYQSMQCSENRGLARRGLYPQLNPNLMPSICFNSTVV